MSIYTCAKCHAQLDTDQPHLERASCPCGSLTITVTTKVTLVDTQAVYVKHQDMQLVTKDTTAGPAKRVLL